MRKLALLLSLVMIMTALVCLTGCDEKSPAGDNTTPAPSTTTEPYNNSQPECAACEDEGCELCDVDFNSGDNNFGDDSYLSDLMKEIYEKTGEMEFPLMEDKLTPEGTQFNDNISYFLGSDDIAFVEGLVSYPLMNSIPHEVILLKMDVEADFEEEMEKMRKNIDPSKWTCVGVDPDDLIVDANGDIVLVVMSEKAKEIHEAFLELDIDYIDLDNMDLGGFGM